VLLKREKRRNIDCVVCVCAIKKWTQAKMTCGPRVIDDPRSHCMMKKMKTKKTYINLAYHFIICPNTRRPPSFRAVPRTTRRFCSFFSKGRCTLLYISRNLSASSLVLSLVLLSLFIRTRGWLLLTVVLLVRKETNCFVRSGKHLGTKNQKVV
jgi:hypothetical protein